MLSLNTPYPKTGRALFILSAALMFGGCVPQGNQAPGSENPYAAAGTSGFYLEQMQRSNNDNKVDWQLLAIGALLNEGQYPQATDQLNLLPASLSDEQQRERFLLEAQLKIARQDFASANTLLNNITPDTLSKAQQGRYWQLRIIAGQSQPSLDVIRAYIAQQQLLNNPVESQKNIDDTWAVLKQLTAPQLSSIVINANENTLQGWLDLLNSYRANSSDVTMLKAAIADWQKRYPYNPAAKTLPTELLSPQPVVAAGLNGKIALLLPLSDQAQGFADAIQRGFNDAKSGLLTSPASTEGNTQPETATPATATPPAATPQDTSASQVSVQVYDTSTQPLEQLLAKAQQDGATLIIGPLLKPDVEKLASLQTSINILALNTPESVQNMANICYFSLSPEDEARDAAQHIWQQTKRAPLLLVPQTPLGERVSKAFTEAWQTQGGGTVLQQSFGSTSELKQAINRGSGLALTGTPVTLTNALSSTANTSNGPIDALYIVASQDEMTLIKPMLAMRTSSRDMVQIYASSRSVQGGAGPDYRLEMEGVQFSDIPLLSGTNSALVQQTTKTFNNNYSLIRLYAMGIDAWTLANHFPSLHQNGFQLNGETGSLTTNQNCVINRTLPWSQYRQGQIVPVN
ncbi:MAG: Penicillin-binding protein activator LpoA [Candidatus Erwinia impunctatus]|nr:Penicillin-binding protein activator LpoA [Culicoides impunctatus]